MKIGHSFLCFIYSSTLWYWTVGGSNPGAEKISASVQTGIGAHPNSYKMGTGSLSWG
jgi:hypothetical protein